MKHLRSYGIFESVSGLREEIKELLANLEDDGFIITFSYMGKDNGYIYIRKPPCDKKKNQFFSTDEVKSDIIRMCEFLEDRYLCDINVVGVGSMLGAKPVTTYQLQEMVGIKTIYAIKINLFSKSDDK